MSSLKECYPSLSNPAGNFRPFDNVNCQYVTNNIMNNNIGINTLHTMPVTKNYPDTVAFAKLLFPNTAECRDTGYMCKSNNNFINFNKLEYGKSNKLYQEVGLNEYMCKNVSNQKM